MVVEARGQCFPPRLSVTKAGDGDRQRMVAMTLDDFLEKIAAVCIAQPDVDEHDFGFERFQTFQCFRGGVALDRFATLRLQNGLKSVGGITVVIDNQYANSCFEADGDFFQRFIAFGTFGESPAIPW